MTSTRRNLAGVPHVKQRLRMMNQATVHGLSKLKTNLYQPNSGFRPSCRGHLCLHNIFTLKHSLHLFHQFVQETFNQLCPLPRLASAAKRKPSHNIKYTCLTSCFLPQEMEVKKCLNIHINYHYQRHQRYFLQSSSC